MLPHRWLLLLLQEAITVGAPRLCTQPLLPLHGCCSCPPPIAVPIAPTNYRTSSRLNSKKMPGHPKLCSVHFQNVMRTRSLVHRGSPASLCMRCVMGSHSALCWVTRLDAVSYLVSVNTLWKSLSWLVFLVLRVPSKMRMHAWLSVCVVRGFAYKFSVSLTL